MARKSILGNKITLLECIKEKQDILLGKFTKKAEKDEQTKEWKNLHEYAVEIGLVSSGRNWNYTRDTFWNAMKTETQNKVMMAKNKKQEPKLNDADELIMDILEGDEQQQQSATPRLYPSLSQSSLASTNTQFSVTSTLVQQQNDANSPKPREPIKRGRQGDSSASKVRVITVELPAEEPQNLNFSPTQKSYVGGVESTVTNKRKRKAMQSIDDDTEDEEEGENALSNKKLRLEVEGLELNNYKARLEILKLEKELQVPRSKFTEDLNRNVNMFGNRY
jgi:hypothetical protein